MKYLINVVETYRFDTEKEATNFIEENKVSTQYSLTKYNCEYKEKKIKGGDVDVYYKVTLTKHFNEEKDPVDDVTVSYSIEG